MSPALEELREEQRKTQKAKRSGRHHFFHTMVVMGGGLAADGFSCSSDYDEDAQVSND